MLRAAKYRLYPTAEQRHALAVNFGCARYVWNDALALIRESYRSTGKSPKWAELSARLPKMKKELPWLAEAQAQVLQQSLANLSAAFEAFFHKRARYPKFKSRRDRQSIRFPQNIKFSGNRIFVGKVGAVLCSLHRTGLGIPRSMTVSLGQDGRYYAAVLFEDGLPEPIPSSKGSAIGIDVGLTDLAVTSNGSKFANPRHLNRADRNLKRKQRKLSRKKKGSKSRNRARLLVARAHAHVVACRRDYAHKLSRRLVDENQVIVFEDLSVKNMLRNPKLSRAIGDAGWAQLRSFCEYKARWAGKTIVVVGRWFPSTKTCSACGYAAEKLPLSVRSWECPKCGVRHDRDVNAAINIRDEGLRVISAGRTPAAAAGGCVRPKRDVRRPVDAATDEGRRA